MYLIPLLLPLLLAAPQAQDPAVKAPGLAASHTPFQSKSKQELRYVWWLPEDYDGKTPRNLSVILHGTGLDYRWGLWNNPPGQFRPLDIVVSVDGTSPGQGDSRLFLGEEKDADSFREFLDEMRTQFAVDRVYLYGHSQGGFFVTYYSGLHPDTVAGVVAHASGAWSWTETGKKAQSVAVAFMHGSADPVVPYRQSPGSFAAFREAGFKKLLLRRLPGYNHWPNCVRATECLDWCEGMTTKNPDRALTLVKELLRPKGVDNQGYEIPPAFAAARSVLRRFQGEGDDPFGNLPAMLQGHAEELAAAIEKLAGDVAKNLDKEIGKKLTLAKEPPLAALRAYREDFRGVDSAERWLDKLGFAKMEKAQAKSVEALFKAWYEPEKPEAERCVEVLAALADGWLYDGYPPELAERLAEWQTTAASLGLDKKTVKAFDEVVDPWQKGWGSRVWEEYQRVCGEWKVPK